jgi:hypothetical protein
MDDLAHRDLFRRCQELVRTLDVPVPFDLDEFVERLQARRGRAVRLVPMSGLPSGLCGVLIGTEDTDIIHFEADTAPVHQNLIALHEIGHMLARDQSPRSDDQILDEKLIHRLLPGLDPKAVRTMLGRSAYSDADELEAEIIATLIMQAAGSTPGARPPLPTGDAAIVNRIESVFG